MFPLSFVLNTTSNTTPLFQIGPNGGIIQEIAKILKIHKNLKKGVKYPATMVTTADTDDRVVPGHSFKFAARLQEVHAGDAPVLIRIETKAGHGAGKPTAKIIEELTDAWAFLVRNLDMKITVK